MKRVLMFDAIPMQGGSKIANAELLKQCNKLNVVGYLVTTNPSIGRHFGRHAASRFST